MEVIFTMLLYNLIKILSDNGFRCHEYSELGDDTLVIENIEISEMYQQITYVEVVQYSRNDFSIFINLKNDYNPSNSDFSIDLSMYAYYRNNYGNYLTLDLDKKNIFIEELHRLNSIGLNIKG